MGHDREERLTVPHIAPAGDGLHLSLDEQEAGILRELAREMRLLLEADIPAGDDVVQRLFPRAYEEEEDQQNYEELIGNELRDVKREALRKVEEALGASGPLDTKLPATDVDEWLRFLNDVRLAIGTRLEVDESKMEKEFDPSDPDAPALSVLHWLGWLQGTMLESLNT